MAQARKESVCRNLAPGVKKTHAEGNNTEDAHEHHGAGEFLKPCEAVHGGGREKAGHKALRDNEPLMPEEDPGKEHSGEQDEATCHIEEPADERLSCECAETVERDDEDVCPGGSGSGELIEGDARKHADAAAQHLGRVDAFKIVPDVSDEHDESPENYKGKQCAGFLGSRAQSTGYPAAGLLNT